MKLGTCMILGATGLASLGLAVGLGIQGCSSSSTEGGGGGTQTGTVPPARPSAPATTSQTEMNFALRKVFLGDGPTGKEWQQYGYNIDGKITDSSYQGVCNPVGTGSKAKLVDGPGGIDNSFGENIVSLISAVTANPSQTISDSINQGKFTIMVDTKGLDATSTQTATGITASLLGGVHFDQGPNAAGSQPKWDGSDDWPLSSDFLSSASDPTSASIKFGNAYVTNGTFVSGDPTDVKMSLSIQGVTLTLPIKHAVLTAQHSGANTMTKGVVAGVVNTDDLINNLRGVAGNISSSLCSGSAFDQIAASIKAASDILSDGTNAAGKDCDAISIGIGFEVDLIKPPSVVGQPAQGTNACGDGGAPPADSGSDTGSSSGGGQDSGSDTGSSQDAAGE